MDADPQRGRYRGRFVWVFMLAAWAAGAVWAFVVMGTTRAAIAGVHPFVSSAATFEDQRPRSLVRGWYDSLGLLRGLAVALLLLAVWAAVLLLLQRRPHPRQWATIFVAVVAIFLGGLFFAGLDAPRAEARPWVDATPALIGQWWVAVGAALLLLIAFVAIRRAPEPVEPEQDRYHIANYTQFNKPAAGAGGGALAEARARAESVLPVDGKEP